MRRIYSDTFFCHTRRTSQPKMRYIYLQNAPDLFRYLILPHQTHLEAENALFCHTKRTADINYPCFATPNAPRSQKCLISPHEKQVNTKVTLE